VKRNVYMDHNATTPLHPQVREAMIAAMDDFGNPSSMHEPGRRARSAIENARENVARLINSQPEDIVFTGSGSEANNTVLNLVLCPSACCSLSCGRRNELVTTRIEHPCILETARCLGDRNVPVQYAQVDEYGRIDPARLTEMIGERTALVSVMMANNEIGTVQDIRAVAGLAHQAGAFMHTDAVQAAGKLPVDVAALDVDFLSLSAHKMYGPKGVGALYVRKGVSFCPFIRGGHQERGRRAGTENTLGIIGMGKAAELRMVEMQQEASRIKALREMMIDGLKANIPDIRINGHPEYVLPTTVNVSFDGVEGEAILLYLDMEGIAVSTGSACSSGSLEPSHVLLATGVGPERAHGSIRFSLGRDTDEEDVRYVIDKTTAVIAKLRKMSTAYKKIL
jgi:cysteine desulfurase